MKPASRVALALVVLLVLLAAGVAVIRRPGAGPEAAPPSPAPSVTISNATVSSTPTPPRPVVSEAVATPGPRDVRLTGRAFAREDGVGVPGVRVQLGIDAAISDTRGFLELRGALDDFDAPRVHVLAPPGWVPSATGEDGALAVDLRDEPAQGRLFVELVRAPVLRGTVLLPDGSPASGARVEVSAGRRVETADGHAPLPASHAVVADAQGGFATSLYPGARNRVVARSDDALAAEVVVATAVSASHEIVLRLKAAAFVAGRVESPGGEPVADVPLVLVASTAEGAAQTVAVRSTFDGAFESGPLLAGQVEITASAPRTSAMFAPEPATLWLEPGERRDSVVVAFESGDRIDGVVVDEEGRPIEGAAVVPSLPGLSARIATDADGRFRVEGIAPGGVLSSLRVAHPDFVPRTRRNLAMLDGEQRFVLQRASAAVLRVVWEEDRSPVPYFAWRLLRTERGEEIDTGKRMEKVDSPDGTARMETLAPGLYRAEVAVLGPDGSMSDVRESVAFDVKVPGQAVDVEVAVRGGAFVEGVVVEAAGGAPVAGARVWFVPRRRDRDAPEGDDAAFAIPPTIADADGRFEFAGVPAGRYAVVARTDELRMAPLDFAVGVGAPAALRLELAPGAVAKGTVRDRDGLPAAGVRVFHAERGPTGEFDSERETITDRDGFYSFVGLAAGSHALRAWHKRLGMNERREVDLLAGEERVVDFDVSGLATLTGRLTVDGEAPGARRPAVYLAAADGTRSPLFDIAADGAYRVETPPGVFNLVLREEGTVGEGEQVVVAAEPAVQTRDFDIGTCRGEIMVFFPDGVAFAAGTTTIAPRASAMRSPSIQVRMDADRRHLPSMMAGEYVATFASDDGAWRGDSDWVAARAGEDAQFAIEARPAGADAVVGVWQREDVPLAGRKWSWNVSHVLDRPGLYEIAVEHRAGRDGVVVDEAVLLVNGRAVAEDKHRGWTGRRAHLANAWRLRLADRPAGAVVTVELGIKGDGGTDSAGEARMGRR